MTLKEMPKVLNLNQAFEVLNVDMIRHKETPTRVADILRYEIEGWITTQQLVADMAESLAPNQIFESVARHLEGNDELAMARQVAMGTVGRYQELEKLAEARARACRDFFEEFGLARMLFLADIYEKYLMVALLEKYFDDCGRGLIFVDAGHLIKVAGALKELNVTTKHDVQILMNRFDHSSKDFDYFKQLSERQFSLTVHELRHEANRLGVEPDDGLDKVEPGSTTEAAVQNTAE